MAKRAHSFVVYSWLQWCVLSHSSLDGAAARPFHQFNLEVDGASNIVSVLSILGKGMQEQTCGGVLHFKLQLDWNLQKMPKYCDLNQILNSGCSCTHLTDQSGPNLAQRSRPMIYTNMMYCITVGMRAIKHKLTTFSTPIFCSGAI